jgi:thiamine-phosphate pyrophosphorylase
MPRPEGTSAEPVVVEAVRERLYLVTPPRIGPDFVPLLERVLATAPVACLRVDLGDASEADWRAAFDLVVTPCHEAEVALVVADHWRLVEPLGLDGVHLADSRVSLREVRRTLGADRIVGAFAGASRHRGMVLAESGADYVSFGPVSDTGLLGSDQRAPDDLFQWWSEMIETPSVAEGGVTEAEASRLGSIADFLVPDRRIWDDPDPSARFAACAAALVGPR